MPLEISTADVVFIDALRVAVNIGPDCWGKKRPQPIELSVYLHLRPTFLDKSGESDDVVDSVHYGHLTKAISSLIEARSETHDAGFAGIDGLVDEVAREAFKLAGESADEVKIVVSAPKLILLAGNFSVETITPRDRQPASGLLRKISVTDLTLPVLIGVNPPERLAKQKVVIDIVFYEDGYSLAISHTEYQSILDTLIKSMESSEYLTLEKFVMEIVRSACVSSQSIAAVTARAQKPSALSFAQFSGVEITRQRSHFV